MQSCNYMNKISKEINKNKIGKYQPNKDIKCNGCSWCQELEKVDTYLNTVLSLEEQNKIDLDLVKVYETEDITKLLLNDVEDVANNCDSLEELNKQVSLLYFHCRNLYRKYLLKNGVEEAKDEKFIYTNKFMLLAKDVV